MSSAAVLNGPHREEHRRWLGPGVGLGLERVDWNEPVLRVEIDRARLRIDEHAEASVVVRHADRKLQDEPEALDAEALERMPTRRPQDEPAEARAGVLRQHLA